MDTSPSNGDAPVPARPPARLPRAYSVAELDHIAGRAQRSALFGMNADQAFTLMCVAQSEGIDAVQALKRYHVILGRPSMRADAMQADFQRRGGQVRWVETNRERCILEAWHPHFHPEHLTLELTTQELVDTGVATAWDKDKREFVVKDTYLKFPRQMLRARAISEMVRAIDPGVVVGVYTPEEVADFAVEDRGPMPTPPPPPAAPAVPPRRAPLARALGEALHRHKPPPPPDAPDDYGWKGFIRREISAATGAFLEALRAAGLPRPDRRDPVCNGFQVVNHLCTLWIDDGLMQAEAISGPDGKRDKDKAAEAVRTAFREYPADVQEEVAEYVADKLMEAYRQAGIEPPERPGDRDEAQATADEEPTTTTAEAT